MEINGSTIVMGLIALIAVGGIGYGFSVGAIDACTWFGYGCEDEVGEEVQQPFPGYQQPATPTQPPAVHYVAQPVLPTAPAGAIPIESLKVIVKDKYTMGNPSVAVSFEFHTPGADVSDPNIQALDTVSVSTAGTGTTTSTVLDTGSSYDLHFNGSTAYYDELLNNWDMLYNQETGKGTLRVNGATYYAATEIGTLADVDTLAEVESSSCLVDGGTDTINYSIGNCAGSAWFKMDIGNSESQSEVRDLVMCFRDSDGDMEGDEVTAIDASRVEGSTNIAIPGTLAGYWKDGMGTSGKRCLKIASVLGSSDTARYKFSFTVTEANLITDEEFEMSFDDLGDISQKQYPSENAKVSTETLTVQRMS
jgi:hypothetical protein